MEETWKKLEELADSAELPSIRRKLSRASTRRKISVVKVVVSDEFMFNCKMRIRRSDDTPVYYKLDGDRFNKTETLKLDTNTEYKVSLEMHPQPSEELTLIKIAGVEYNFELVNDPQDEVLSKYRLVWSTHGLDPTSNKHRTDVPVSLKFKNFKALDIKIQIKFYDVEDDIHVTWGQVLHGITVDCTVGKGSFSSGVDSMKFH